MKSSNQSGAAISFTAIQTAESLRTLYFIRTAFSVIWIILLSAFVKTNNGIARILFIIYPVWDVFATWLDIKANPPYTSKTPQYASVLLNITLGVRLVHRL